MEKTNSNSLRAAIIASLTALPNDQVISSLSMFTSRDWRRLGNWLHASGLALYFLDEIQRRSLTALLPHDVFQSLLQNREDNRERVNSLISEFVQLNTAYLNEGIGYINLKGLSVGPEYCPDFTLRSQFDLDFLVCDDHVPRCVEVMRRLGYSVVAEGGGTIELRAGERSYPEFRDFYKPRSQKVVELHVCPAADVDRLPRANGLIGEFVFPTLSREQIFLRHALHLTKHLRSEWTRASWMLELSRAIADARRDATFWQRVREQSTSSEAAWRVGVAVLATSTVFGTAISRELSGWSADLLPGGVRQWVRDYALPVVSASFPGSKLYLLLERELLGDSRCYQSQRRSVLWPVRVPGTIATSVDAKTRLKNLVSDAKYVGFRAAFHIREGLRFIQEERKWKKQGSDAGVAAVARSSSAA